VGRRRHRHDQPAGGKLAREAEIAYATMALVTDYDCWHPDHDSVTIDMIIGLPHRQREDGAGSDRQGRGAARRDPSRSRRTARWKSAISTHADAIPDNVKRDLAPLSESM
jgi:5'-methylthioadenosine phosphorylase